MPTSCYWTMKQGRRIWFSTSFTRFSSSHHWRFIHTFDWLAFRLSIRLWYSWVPLFWFLVLSTRRGSIDCTLTDCHIPTWLLFRCRKEEETLGPHRVSATDASVPIVPKMCRPVNYLDNTVLLLNCPVAEWLLLQGRPTATQWNDDVLRGKKCTQAVAEFSRTPHENISRSFFFTFWAWTYSVLQQRDNVGVKLFLRYKLKTKGNRYWFVAL